MRAINHEKSTEFVKELVELCEKHGLCLYPSLYHSIQVWPLEHPRDLVVVKQMDWKDGRGTVRTSSR